MFFLSIIVPVYNVQNYLKACLDSILRQQLASVEVILVNDGSTDASGEIARSYAERYGYIKLIEQENQGISVARNIGLDNAKGEYVLFVDSDDYLSNSGITELLKKAKDNKLDIVIGNYFRVSENSNLNSNKVLKSHLPMSGRAWFKESLKRRRYWPNLFYRIYRRHFLLDNNIFFIPQLINEDVMFSTQLFCADPKMMCFDVPFYCYRLRSGSITTKQDYESCMKRFDSDLYTFEKSLALSNTLEDSRLALYIMDYRVKSLEHSLLMLLRSVDGRLEALDDVLEKLARLQVWRYIRVRRFSLLKKKLLARFSIRLYVNHLCERELRKSKKC